MTKFERNLQFELSDEVRLPRNKLGPFASKLLDFREFGKESRHEISRVMHEDGRISETPTLVNEFWTAKQRDAHSLHEISYRACFKPQLPGFFIQRLSRPGDWVYDPYMGRGTTLLEAALQGRVPCGSDINPLSKAFIRPRLNPPELEEIERRLEEIDFAAPGEEEPEDLLVFYHRETLREIVSLRRYFQEREAAGAMDGVDEWLRMVALNRLTGHSPGFFSVYTMPPNQAVSLASQIKINRRRNQVPPRRVVPDIIRRKSRRLLRDLVPAERKVLSRSAPQATILANPADSTPEIPSESIALVVTSPPFLNVVDYATDNWLRCWFMGLDPKAISLTNASRLEVWMSAISRTFRELARILRPGGAVAFEVGEVRKGEIQLETLAIRCAVGEGLEAEVVLINSQVFTKTSHCWGVANNAKGTNSNRIVVFRKPISQRGATSHEAKPA